MMHDHSKVTHKISCPYCGEILSFHAHDDEEALVKAMQAAKGHMDEKHEDKKTSKKKLQEMVENNVERVEE